MKRMMDDAERRLRAKLRSLPNGTWRAVGYQEQSHEGDRQLHEIRLAVTKEDDHLTFDFTGTAPQAGMINCPYPGLRGGVIFMMLPMLAGDIPWAAGGLLRCIDIISEEGTLNNALFPAAVGKGPVGPAWASGNLVNECLAKMLDAKPETRTHVQSVCCGTWDLVVMAGLDERTSSPNPFVSLVFDAMAGGYGAQVKVFAIQLVLAALLAADGGSGRVLVLDELGNSLGDENRKDVLADLDQVAREQNVTILGACQNSVIEDAAARCGQILWFSQTDAFNKPTRAWGFDEDGRRVDVIAPWLREGRTLA
jgi:hypothetical protein